MQILNQITNSAVAIRRWVAAVTIYFTVAGLVTFSLFILEESFQTVMFGSWPAQDAKRWDIVVESTDYMESIADTIKWMNRFAGWIQPFAFIAYGSYAQAAEHYLTGLRAKVLAFAPEEMLGREVHLRFQVKRSEQVERAFFYSGGGNVGVMCHEPDDDPEMGIDLTGILYQHGGLFYIPCVDFDPVYLEHLVQDFD